MTDERDARIEVAAELLAFLAQSRDRMDRLSPLVCKRRAIFDSMETSFIVIGGCVAVLVGDDEPEVRARVEELLREVP